MGRGGVGELVDQLPPCRPARIRTPGHTASSVTNSRRLVMHVSA